MVEKVIFNFKDCIIFLIDPQKFKVGTLQHLISMICYWVQSISAEQSVKI